MTSKKLPNSKSLSKYIWNWRYLFYQHHERIWKELLPAKFKGNVHYVSIHDGTLKNRKTSDSYHIAGTRKVIVEQTLQSHPTNRPILIVPEAVVVHGEEIASKCVVCDLHLHAVINSKKQCKYDLGERCSMFY